MPFVSMSPSVFAAPLGPVRLNTWLRNLDWLRGGFARQHLASTGEHNAMEVPRVARRITFTGPSTYALANTSTDITAVTRVAAGHIRLTLAASRFTTDMRVQVNVAGTGIESKPWLWRVQVTSATQLEVYLGQLSSALGSGNTWAAADASFDIAIHTAPLAPTAWPVATFGGARNNVPGWAIGQTVDGSSFAGSSDYNEALGHIASHRKQFLVEHDVNGLHNTRQVARHFVQGRYKAAGLYDIIDQLGVNSFTVSEPSLGTVTCTLSAAVTAAVSAFVCADWTRQVTSAGAPGNINIINAATTTTVTTLYMYRYDVVANSWNRARADFWLVLHSG
jgi:hypothetical protein